MSATRRLLACGPRFLVVVIILASAIAVVVGVAGAGGAPRLLLVSDGGPELARKIAAEATVAGFDVVEWPLASLGSAVTDPSPEVVAIVIVRSPSEVELRIGRGGARTTSLLVEPTAEPATFPVLVVEEARARLVELRLWVPAPSLAATAPPPPVLPEPPRAGGQATPPTAAGERAAHPAVTRPVGEPPSVDASSSHAWLWIGAGPALLLPAGGLGPTVQGLVAATVEPHHRIRIGAVALLPLHDTSVEAAEGAADVGVSLMALRLAYAPWRDGPWGASAGIGGGPLVLAMRAQAPEPYIGREETTIAGAYFMDASVERTFADWFRVQVSIMAGVSAPRPVIRFDDRDVAAWGRTFGGVAARGELGLSPGAEGGAR